MRVRARQVCEASVAVTKTLALTPHSADAWYQKGSIAHMQGDLASALAAYDRALQGDATHVEARVSPAGLLIDLGRQDAADKDIEELQRTSPREPRVAYLKAVLAERAGDAAAAQRWLREVTGLIDPVRNENEGTSWPNHSMDNKGFTNLIALQFGQAVNLTHMQLGWTYNDSDISVLAYTASSGSASIADKTAGQLLGSGWSLIGNFADVGASPQSINEGGISSSWWLISGYNSSFGGDFEPTNSDYVKPKYDYVKLLAVAGTPTPPGNGVLEPGSLALAAIAFGGIWGFRRRSRKAD